MSQKNNLQKDYIDNKQWFAQKNLGPYFIIRQNKL